MLRIKMRTFISNRKNKSQIFDWPANTTCCYFGIKNISISISAMAFSSVQSHTFIMLMCRYFFLWRYIFVVPFCHNIIFLIFIYNSLILLARYVLAHVTLNIDKCWPTATQSQSDSMGRTNAKPNLCTFHFQTSHLMEIIILSLLSIIGFSVLSFISRDNIAFHEENIWICVFIVGCYICDEKNISYRIKNEHLGEHTNEKKNRCNNGWLRVWKLRKSRKSKGLSTIIKYNSIHINI